MSGKRCDTELMKMKWWTRKPTDDFIHDGIPQLLHSLNNQHIPWSRFQNQLSWHLFGGDGHLGDYICRRYPRSQQFSIVWPLWSVSSLIPMGTQPKPFQWSKTTEGPKKKVNYNWAIDWAEITMELIWHYRVLLPNKVNEDHKIIDGNAIHFKIRQLLSSLAKIWHGSGK